MKNNTSTTAECASSRLPPKKDEANSPPKQLVSRLGICFLVWQAALSIFFGLYLYLDPYIALNFLVNDQYDGVHMHMIRCIGSILIGQGVMCSLWLTSADDACNSSVLFNRLLVSALCCAATYNADYEDRQGLFNARTFAFLLVLFFFEMAISAVLLSLKARMVGQSLLNPQRRSINALTQLDFIASLIIGSLWYAMPGWLLHRQVRVNLNISHIFLSRVFGAYLLGTGLLSTKSIYFNTERDRCTFVIGRALICVNILFGQIYSQYAYAVWWQDTHWVGISLFTIWTVLAGFVLARELQLSVKGTAARS